MLVAKATSLPKAVSASAFVPARSSKHRHAALALCRALLREARRIPLPKDLRPTAQSAHPVEALVIHQFKWNRGDTSPRLVFAALTAGYKFLSLFKQAQDPSSPSHAEVTSYLRTRPKPRYDPTPARKQKKPKQDEASKPPSLLIRKIAADKSLSYEPNWSARPVPFEALREGRRHIPQLVVTSEGYPFLRFKKPQPSELHWSARRHKEKTHFRATMFTQLKAEGLEVAKEEDHWEKLVEELRAQEEAGEPGSKPPAAEATYGQVVDETATFLWDRLNEARFRHAARVQGLQRLVEEEQRLYREETPRRLAAKLEAAKQREASKEISIDAPPVAAAPTASPMPSAPPAMPTESPTPRPRGRPRKTPESAPATSTEKAAPRPRGRPRKTSEAPKP